MIYLKTKYTHRDREGKDTGKICKAEVTVHRIILHYTMLTEERTLTSCAKAAQYGTKDEGRDNQLC